MTSSDKKAEQELQKIRKLPDNKRCANCLEPGVPLLTAVVMPFKIFVCSTCKSAHQSFSHRCKSTQMSIWTMEEVKSLDDKHGGGNRLAQETWLADVRSSDRPKEGDSLDRFKSFVQKAYIDKRWKGSARKSSEDDERDSRSSRRDDDRSRDDRSSRREAAPAALAPPVAGNSSRAVGSDSTGRKGRDRDAFDNFDPDASTGRKGRDRDAFDDFNPDAPQVGGAGKSSGASTSLLDDGFDPNASSGAAAGVGSLDLFDPNAGSGAGVSNNSFDPLGGGGNSGSFDPFAGSCFVSAAPGQATPWPSAAPTGAGMPGAGMGVGGGYNSNSAGSPSMAGQGQPGLQMPFGNLQSQPAPSSAPLGMPNAMAGAGMQGGMQAGMPNGMNNGMPGARPQGSTPGNLAALHGQQMPFGGAFGMSGGTPSGMPGAMPGAMQGGMPNAMQNSMSGGMHGGMPGGMPGMSSGMSGGMSSGMAGGMPGGMAAGMPGGMRPNGMPGAMQCGPGGMTNGMPGAMTNGTMPFGSPNNGQFGAAQPGFGQGPQQSQAPAPRLEDLQQNLMQLYQK